jgi:hypothetical protein
MKKKACLGALCSVLLLAAAPALAQIVYTLENPSVEQSISGISVVSGWAYAVGGLPVTVTLRINGQDTDPAVTIPCCGPRGDVQVQNPGAPPNTGFGLLLNYGIFDPATLTSIGVRISSPNDPQVVIDHQVTLAKPGARASDPSTYFAFLEQLSPTGRAAIDAQELILAPVTVADNNAGGTRKSTLRLLWTSNTQSFGIIQAASGTSFDGVQTIFNNKCTTACHDTATKAGGLDLSPKKSFAKTVAVRSDDDPQQRFLVNPSKVAESYLYQKIIANGDSIVGTRMPPDCPGTPTSCLSDPEVQTISGWIDEGAPPPQQ